MHSIGKVSQTQTILAPSRVVMNDILIYIFRCQYGWYRRMLSDANMEGTEGHKIKTEASQYMKQSVQ